MVESSGCAAFGHPAAVLGSLPDSIGRKPWRRRLRRASRISARRRRANRGRCPCRAPPVARDRFRSLFRFRITCQDHLPSASRAFRRRRAGGSGEPFATDPFARSAVSRRHHGRLRCRSVTGQQTCQYRASKTSIAVKLHRLAARLDALARSRRPLTAAMAILHAPQRPIRSTAIRPRFGRAVPYRPRGDGRPRAGAPS
jgi:hypothetical protein